MLLGPVLAFQHPSCWARSSRRHQQSSRLAAASASSSTSDAPKQATLDSRTPWLLSLTLTRDGFDPVRGDMRIRFVETKGYEPPQVS